ncbi:MAG: hypothetical protein ACREJ3_02165, partial [Polyangiaceae bacterium]
RWYDEALAFPGFRLLRGPVRSLLARGQYRSPRLRDVEGSASALPAKAQDDAGTGEIVLVVGYGRVPEKVPERVPIGLALTWFSGALAPTDVAAANRIAAQGLVTWINFPALGREAGSYAVPTATLDGGDVPLEEAVNVTSDVRGEWKKIQGKIIVSAITRMIARYAAGSAAKAAAGNGIVGLLLSLGTQATLTALDTPDTRSWETLPARVAIARVPASPGEHVVRLEARGVTRTARVSMGRGGWSVVSLMGLR